MDYAILVINPGSTSDDIGFYRGEREVFAKVVRYKPSELKPFEGKRITEQFAFRKQVVLDALKENGIKLSELSAVIGRGGLLKPILGGTYSVNERMVTDLTEETYGDHPCNLGGLLAAEIGHEAGVPSFIADPPIVDEMEPLARYSGRPELPRISIFHALNQKRVARMAADKLGRKYEDLNLVIVHAGGGISCGAHKKGLVVDINNALDGEGPFTPQRSGTLPVGGIIRTCFSGRYTAAEMRLRIKGHGGLMAYTGTSDVQTLEKYIETGEVPEGCGIDPVRLSRAQALECIEAMAYQVSKEIGALSAALSGKVDAIVLTGGLAYDKRFVGFIESRVGWIAPMLKYPGGDEKRALRDAAISALQDPQSIRQYDWSTEPITD